FFFSSRRRHTRSKRDWSSDVCSSDLTQIGQLIVDLLQNRPDLLFLTGREFHLRPPAIGRIRKPAPRVAVSSHFIFGRSHDEKCRSEERRVGKECRSRW